MNKEWAAKIIFPVVVSVVTAVILSQRDLASLKAEVVNEQYHIRQALNEIKEELKSINVYLRESK